MRVVISIINRCYVIKALSQVGQLLVFSDSLLILIFGTFNFTLNVYSKFTFILNIYRYAAFYAERQCSYCNMRFVGFFFEDGDVVKGGMVVSELLTTGSSETGVASETLNTRLSTWTWCSAGTLHPTSTCCAWKTVWPRFTGNTDRANRTCRTTNNFCVFQLENLEQLDAVTKKRTNIPEPTFEETSFKVQAMSGHHSDNIHKKVTGR